VYFSNDLDACGVTGTGKTTTVINTLLANGIRFYNINCIMTEIEKYLHNDPLTID
jgi:hypothetical protein